MVPQEGFEPSAWEDHMKHGSEVKFRPLTAWLVLGEQNAGKSTLIRHLSG
jgi:hypothetical protein